MIDEYITVTVPGLPVAKARPRVTQKGVYTPKKTKEYEERIKAVLISSYSATQLFSLKEKPICLWCTFYFPSPKRKKTRYPLKPDLDNLVKAVMDALNGLVVEKDGQVVSIIAKKRYGMAKTVIYLWEEEEVIQCIK
jgi:Holliday junction resolvase RusA-like endonuclease